jgi:DNA-binding LacI/PurR family transcriptional regulator
VKAKRNAKYQRIYDYFRKAILEGAVKPGDQLPTETELCAEFAASRPTVSRALALLAKEGLVRRRAGSGTFVSDRAENGSPVTRRLGLLIPGLGATEIFEPMCAHIAAVAEAEGFHLVWGSLQESANSDGTDLASKLCQRYIEQGVEGVFFAPLELDRQSASINQQIVRTLQKHGIVVVLLDRDLGPFPRRSDCDLVALDNLQAGYLIAAHLLRRGCRRIDFLALPHSAQTVAQRLEGVRAALYDAGVIMPKSWIHSGIPTDDAFVQRDFVDAGIEAVICANDATAASLMTTLSRQGVEIPEQIRICGFDDVKYAANLRVPLTTIHQPCAEIGRIAVLTMMDRFTRHNLPGRKILLTPQLVVRESCGKLAAG